MKFHHLKRTFQALALASFMSSAYAVTDISTCQTINLSGSYRLTRDLVTSGNCLLVNISDVTIDLAGHRLVGSANPLGRGISIPSSRHGITNVVVRNGTIRNFNQGINLLDVHYVRIESMRVIDNQAEGIVLSSSAIVSNSFVADNGGAGIRLRDVFIAPAYGGTVTDNVVLRNGLSGNTLFAGIEAESPGALITRNQVRQNGSHGIAAVCPATVAGNASTGNNTRGLGGVSIKLDGASCVNKDNLSVQ